MKLPPTANYLPLRFIAIGMLSWLLFAMLSACAHKKIAMPPVTPAPTGSYHFGKFVWHDLLTNDIPSAKKFYGALFGWEFESSQPGDTAFTVIKYKGLPIGSMIYIKRLNPEVSESRWLASLSVADVGQAVEHFRTNGGKIYREPKNYPERGRLAVVGDPQGAVLALLKASGGDPADEKPELNQWFWHELITENPVEAVSFYEALVDYRHEAREVRKGITYYVLKNETVPRAGVLKAPWEGIPPVWLPYIRVEDVSPLAARVESLGGRLILAPDSTIRNGSVAIIADPTGAAVAIQKWPFEASERSESQ